MENTARNRINVLNFFGYHEGHARRANMTPDDFRILALSFPEAVESEHMGHPDFRVRGKIFASLSPDDQSGMVKLTVGEQKSFVRDEPKVFQPSAGAWGQRGYTKVVLKHADELTVRQALTAAWRNTAPNKLIKQFDNS